MDNFVLDEILYLVKRCVLWFLVTVIFTTRELQDEASNHVLTGTVRIPGVCYGCNLVRGYQAVGKLFPRRSLIVRLDFITGYLKMLLILASVAGLFLLAAPYLT